MPGIADKFTQSAQGRLLWPGMTANVSVIIAQREDALSIPNSALRFRPPDNAVVALEPYTSAPDAFNLAARGVAAGMRELAPGQTFEAGFEIRLSAP